MLSHLHPGLSSHFSVVSSIISPEPSASPYLWLCPSTVSVMLDIRPKCTMSPGLIGENSKFHFINGISSLPLIYVATVVFLSPGEGN